MSNHPSTTDDRRTDTETEQTGDWQAAVVDAIQYLEGYGDPGGDWSDKQEFQMKAAHDRLAQLDTSEAPRDVAETIRDVVDVLAETPDVPHDEHGVIGQTALAKLAPLLAGADGDADPADGRGADQLRAAGFETANLEIELDTAFIELLEIEAADQDKSVEELVKNWLWVTWTSQYRKRYSDFTADVDIEIPEGAYRRAQLFAEACDADVDDILYNHVLDFTPNWIVDVQGGDR